MSRWGLSRIRLVNFRIFFRFSPVCSKDPHSTRNVSRQISKILLDERDSFFTCKDLYDRLNVKRTFRSSSEAETRPARTCEPIFILIFLLLSRFINYYEIQKRFRLYRLKEVGCDM